MTTTTARKRLTAIVLNQLDSGSSFAIADDSEDQIFIRSVIAKNAGIEVGDEIEAVVVPNADRKGGCPWFALRVDVLDEDDESVPSTTNSRWDPFTWSEITFPKEASDEKRNWEKEAYAFLDKNGPATTSQIANAVGNSTANIRTYLCKMNDRGEVVRADIWTSGGQSKASGTIWAVEYKELLPKGEPA